MRLALVRPSLYVVMEWDVPVLWGDLTIEFGRKSMKLTLLTWGESSPNLLDCVILLKLCSDLTVCALRWPASLAHCLTRIDSFSSSDGISGS